jgi:hypothetical protein
MPSCWSATASPRWAGPFSEAYHRLNTLTAEVRRCIVAEQIAALKGTRPAYRSRAEIEEMYRFAGRIIYPTRAEAVMREEAAE